MRPAYLYIIFGLLVSLTAFSACQEEVYTGPLPEKIDFNFHIRPILSDNCFLCHGPDPSSREAELRLDLEETASAVLKNGRRPIHPGNWKKSEVMRRVMSHDPDIQMPPPQMKKRLSPKEIALMKKWIEEGAEWKDYWAFIPPQMPGNADFNLHTTPTQKIDFLIDQSIRQQGLPISEKADRETLIRRLSYLLTGLPPTPHEVGQFLENEASNAYENLVDQLLSASQYGERWARHWMDLVRFAAYKGHEFDYPILGAWQYRDYLIRAFNEDVPYDQFVREHIAGDLLETPRVNPENGFNESIHGPQYVTFGEGKHSPVSIRQEEADIIDNIIDVTTKTFQGLTVGCAKCHDHKFDAIPTTDYYALYGIFESTRYALLPSNTNLKVAEQKTDSIEAIKQMIRVLTAERFKDQKTRPAQKVRKVLTKNSPPVDSRLIADFRNGTLNNWFSDGLAFQNQNASGQPVFNEKGNLISLSGPKASSRILGTGIQGALRSPTFTIDKKNLLVRAAGDTAMIRVIVDNFQLIQDPIYGSLQTRVTDPNMKDYIFDLSMVQGRKAYIELQPGTMIAIDYKQHFFTFPSNGWIEAEYAQLFEGDIPPPPPALPEFPLVDRQKATDNWKNGEANPKEVAFLNDLLQITPYKDARINSLLNQWQKLADQLRDSTFFQGVTEGDAQMSPVFIRGNIGNESEEKVPHRFLSALEDYSAEFPATGSGRKALAESIASPQNPLTARVMVNRVWHHLFGRGIVETVDNFGLQGKIPSHPELLDYLALQFIEEGWSVKKLIRHIVLTEAFQRSAVATTVAATKDPQNIFLSHFPVRRLEGEAIRDGLLAVSGQLDNKSYGPPFEIYLTGFIKGRGRPRESGPLDGHGRRSIYQTIRRNFLPPFMLTFDMPAPFSTFGNRNITNVPAQSLTMMNDPLVQQLAEKWAEKILRTENSFEERINNVYLTAFARKPKEKELAQAKTFFEEQKAFYEDSEQDIWADFCHSIFMMKEFIFLTG